VTIIMVVGANMLSKKKTLVRYLPSVETLGSATIIATDKTGTITLGKLEVKEIFGKAPLIQKVAALSCIKESLDPLDQALVQSIEEFDSYHQNSKIVESIPFDTKLRFAGNIIEEKGVKQVYLKGAYESLKEKAKGQHCLSFDEKIREMSQRGLRVLAFAKGEQKENVQIVGLIGFYDPPKKNVKEAIRLAHNARIRSLMLTGDHPLTAQAIAQEVGIEHKKVLTGVEIEKMSDHEVIEALKEVSVIARILPENKLRIVQLLQKNKEVVAVSGDGVNDVPALRAADLGIAMGSGTEAAQDAAKMVITDNNLQVIVDAVEKGRVIAQNIRKVIYYLLSSSLMEIVLISFAVILMMPLPLLPIQILWINFVTDGVLDKLFVFTKAEEDVMNRAPKKPEKQFFDGIQLFRVLFFGVSMGLSALWLFSYLNHLYSYRLATTITFTSVVSIQWFNGIQAQKEKQPFFLHLKKSFQINPYIYLGACLGIALQLLAVYVLSPWFHTEKMALHHWFYPIMFSIIGFLIIELRKWLERIIFHSA